VLVIVDYGMGNLRSVEKALERIGHGARVSARPEDVAGAERLIVPGVGAFGDAMAALRERGLVEPIREFAARGRPFLGICLGLQLLFEESDEGRGPAAEGALCPAARGPGPLISGLGLLKGRVVRFGEAVLGRGLKVPHMGWNVVRPARPCRLFAGMPPEGVYFYFAHSYYADPADRSVVAAETDYGGRFTSAVAAGNILATQFHPEKSQAAGLRLLENFIGRA
jgi:glutamine amidotransferase